MCPQANREPGGGKGAGCLAEHVLTLGPQTGLREGLLAPDPLQAQGEGAWG